MKRIALWTVVLCMATAIEAGAQSSGGTYTGFVTGHVGAVTGGDLTEPRATLGVSVAVHEQTGWGAEIDFGHASDATAGRQVLDVTSYMVNAIWAKPDGLVRPFGNAGAGILQVNGCDSPCTVAARTYDFGVNAGG